MKKISLLLIFCLTFSTYIFAIPEEKTYSNYLAICTNFEASLETSIKKKPIKFLFYDPARFKVKTVDKVVDSNKTIKLKSTSYSIWSMDAGDFIRFSRILVGNDKIYEFKYWAKSKHGKVITYNFCGKKIKKEKVLIEDFWDLYFGIYKRK